MISLEEKYEYVIGTRLQDRTFILWSSFLFKGTPGVSQKILLDPNRVSQITILGHVITLQKIFFENSVFKTGSQLGENWWFWGEKIIFFSIFFKCIYCLLNVPKHILRTFWTIFWNIILITSVTGRALVPAWIDPPEIGRLSLQTFLRTYDSNIMNHTLFKEEILTFIGKSWQKNPKRREWVSVIFEKKSRLMGTYP